MQPSLLKRLETEAKLLHSAYEYFGKASRQDLNLSYAAEWVLDNFYLVQQTVRQIGEGQGVSHREAQSQALARLRA